MKIYFKTSVTLVTLAILSGCGDSGSGGGYASGTIPLPNEFHGVWRQPCYEEEGQYISASSEYSARTMFFVERYFKDAQCTVPADTYHENKTVYDLLAYEKTVPTALGDAYAVDYTLKKFTADSEPLTGFKGTTDYGLLLVKNDAMHAGYNDGSNDNFGGSAADRPTEIGTEAVMVR